MIVLLILLLFAWIVQFDEIRALEKENKSLKSANNGFINIKDY